VSTTAASVKSDTEQGLEVPIGARIESVSSGGPAQRLGLKPGDLVVGFDRERVEYPSQLARWVAATSPGTEVEFVWVRDDAQHMGRVALSEAREVQPAWSAEEVTPAGPESEGDRIAEIERQSQRLNRELRSLKSKPAAPARP
jgi:membrane-associated protease RseP (regulator of RpoE activity)